MRTIRRGDIIYLDEPAHPDGRRVLDEMILPSTELRASRRHPHGAGLGRNSQVAHGRIAPSFPPYTSHSTAKGLGRSSCRLTCPSPGIPRRHVRKTGPPTQLWTDSGPLPSCWSSSNTIGPCLGAGPESISSSSSPASSSQASFSTRANNPDRVRTFYIRRALRIFPLYYAVMLALLLTWPILHWHFSWGWLAWPTYVGNFTPFIHPYADHSPLQQLADFQPTGTFNGSPVKLYLGHFWSLCVEEQFYFVWPWLVFWINSRRKLLWVCAVVVPLTLFLRLFAAHHAPSWMIGNLLLQRCTFFRLDSLLLGGLVALALRGPAREAILLWSRRLLAVVAVAFIIAILVPSVRHWLSLPGQPGGQSLIPGGSP